MIVRIDHIGIAVRNLEEQLKLYTDVLGLGGVHSELVPSEGARIGFVRIGESDVELLEATTEDGVLARFIEKHGEGVHHIALQVEDCAATLAAVRATGLRTVDEVPRPGAGGTKVAFIHPKSAGGVLIELVEHPR
ncbi:MAG TPA: methylmalonyl-CoA epimerase [Chloroflexota bacterium]|nr:methylmalonyl-CoA epimerase [Chloroflexota bacterium]